MRYITSAGVTVIDPESGAPVPADGETMGEIATRGNTVMMGYLKNPEASDAAFKGGWFRSGDLGVMHPDGYVEVKDRSKDIIISGGENISSLEVEEIMSRHPAIREVAVVAKPDSHWGETPCAYVALKEGVAAPSADDLKAWCKQHMAGFKRPHYIVFGELQRPSPARCRNTCCARRRRRCDAAVENPTAPSTPYLAFPHLGGREFCEDAAARERENCIQARWLSQSSRPQEGGG